MLRGVFFCVGADFYVSDAENVGPLLAISVGCSCCHIDAPAPIRFQRLEACATDMAKLPLPRLAVGSRSCWLAPTAALPGSNRPTRAQ